MGSRQRVDAVSPDQPPNYRVTIFGSARLRAGTAAYEGVKQLAAELTKMGCDIISGGGPGLMQAANEGAHSIEKAMHDRRSRCDHS